MQHQYLWRAALGLTNKCLFLLLIWKSVLVNRKETEICFFLSYESEISQAALPLIATCFYLFCVHTKGSTTWERQNSHVQNWKEHYEFCAKLSHVFSWCSLVCVLAGVDNWMVALAMCQESLYTPLKYSSVSVTQKRPGCRLKLLLLDELMIHWILYI